MLSLLPGPVRGVLSLSLYVINTIVWTLVLFAVALLKFCVPVPAWRKLCSKVMIGIGNIWIFFNNCNMRFIHKIHWDVDGTDGLKMNRWYLVVANHQSWTDILVLQKILYRKAPFHKFFLKKELFWVPFLGLAWWALDYPFLERSSSAQKDIETTMRACEKFKTFPVSIMNFVEGTRFTAEKHRKQRSPYSHLLKPKAGGIAFVLAAMGEQLDSILDVTIAYPEGAEGFWGFLCGRVTKIKVRVESLPINEELSGDYFKDREFRKRFMRWLNALWAEKDKRLAALLNEEGSTLRRGKA
ncbi:MAG: acyltransferase [Syntrophobacterales bacterium]|jgi:1-acyl-sn-glycerol-3-phosphate acyltransferase